METGVVFRSFDATKINTIIIIYLWPLWPVKVEVSDKTSVTAVDLRS